MKYLYLIGFIFIAQYSIASTLLQIENSGDNQKSYYLKHKLTYEIKNVVLPDSALIEKINWAFYESLRQADTRFEVYDTISGYWIILYSKTEVEKKAATQKPLQRFKLPETKNSKNQF